MHQDSNRAISRRKLKQVGITTTELSIEIQRRQKCLIRDLFCQYSEGIKGTTGVITALSLTLIPGKILEWLI